MNRVIQFREPKLGPNSIPKIFYYNFRRNFALKEGGGGEGSVVWPTWNEADAKERKEKRKQRLRGKERPNLKDLIIILKYSIAWRRTYTKNFQLYESINSFFPLRWYCMQQCVLTTNSIKFFFRIIQVIIFMWTIMQAFQRKLILLMSCLQMGTLDIYHQKYR